MDARTIYYGSNGKDTTLYYAELVARGPLGQLARCLFRACKNSERAKKYQGGTDTGGNFRKYSELAYDKKNESLKELTEVLTKYAAECKIEWGWQIDEAQKYHKWILYVDLPDSFGQCSFHQERRGEGPNYNRAWDGKQASSQRIIAMCDMVFSRIPKQKAAPMDSDNFVLKVGKRFNGVKLKDIDDLTYLDWLVGQKWLWPDTREAITQFLAKPANKRELEEQLESKGGSR